MYIAKPLVSIHMLLNYRRLKLKSVPEAGPFMVATATSGQLNTKLLGAQLTKPAGRGTLYTLHITHIVHLMSYYSTAMIQMWCKSM